jgi:flagellar basal body-associated protein FliL
VTVVIITMRIMSRGGTSQTVITTSEDYIEKEEQLSWYDAIPEIRTRTSDENATTVIVKVNIGYERENKAVQTELIARTPRIQDQIRRFFAMKTSDELTPANEEELKIELEEMINRIMADGRIKEVIFLDFNIMEF